MDHEFTNTELGFGDGHKCRLRFIDRADGSLGCRLILSEGITERINRALKATVDIDKHGDILVNLVDGDMLGALEIMFDKSASIRIDRYAEALWLMRMDDHGCGESTFASDSYDALVFADDTRIILAPSR